MRMTELIEKLRQLLAHVSSVAPEKEDVSLDAASVERLMSLLCETRDDELSCEEVFNCMDEYAECLESRHDVAHDVGGKRALVEHHLSLCPDCRDELHALIHALENANGEPE